MASARNVAAALQGDTLEPCNKLTTIVNVALQRNRRLVVNSTAAALSDSVRRREGVESTGLAQRCRPSTLIFVYKQIRYIVAGGLLPAGCTPRS